MLNKLMAKKVTLDHQIIQNWAEDHRGIPELITQKDIGNKITGLRLDFPGEDDKDLPETEDIEKLSWQQFFKEFENLKLAFEYETEIVGDPSLAYRFLKRDAIKE
jgi:hypothetical protein